MNIIKIVGIVFCVGSLCMSCASRNAVSERAQAEAQPFMFPDVVHSPQGAESFGSKEYFLSDYDEEENQGFIWKIVKDDVYPLYDGLRHPRGLAWDLRRAELYVADENELKAFKPKDDNQKAPKIFKVPFETDPETRFINDVTFSLMNRKAYVCESSQGTVWSFDPKTREFRKLLQKKDFEALGYGGPNAIYVSTDGKYLYLATDTRGWPNAKQAAVLKYSLRDHEVSVFAHHPDFSSLLGLEFYANRFFIGDSMSGKVWAIPRNEPQELVAFTSLARFSKLQAMALYYDQALLAGQKERGDRFKVERILFNALLKKP